MSLIYEGDTIENFGKYLPTPYIKRIRLSTDTHTGDGLGPYPVTFTAPKCTISACLFFKVSDDEDVDQVLSKLDEKLVFYFLFAASAPDAEYTRDEARKILSGEENVFSYCNRFEVFGSDYDKESDVYLAAIELKSFLTGVEQGPHFSRYEFLYGDTAAYSPTNMFYDENGDKILQFEIEVSRTINMLSSGETTWDSVEGLSIFAFSSTYNYYSNKEELDSELENLQLFNRRTSDLAHETVFAGGELINQIQVAYFDSEDVLYNGNPLQSIDKTLHKSDSIKHQTIVGYFNDLLAQFTTETETVRLKKVRDQISYVLATYGNRPDLVYQLDLLRKTFPDKSNATPVGKLYFRFKKRIASVNRDIKLNPKLSRKVIRNAKLLDERSPPVYAPREDTSWLETYTNGLTGHSPSFLYSNGYMDRTALYSFPADSAFQQSETAEYEGNIAAATAGGTRTGAPSDDPMGKYADPNLMTGYAWDDPSLFDAIVRQSGYFFFDYEKALRKVANINQIVDVGRLISYGIPTDYKHFRVSNAFITRPESGMSRTTGEYGKKVQISAHMNQEVSYPLTRTTATTADGNRGLVINSPGFYNYNPTPGSGLALTQEEHTYLMVRNFELMQTRGFSYKIPDYRLMCFEFQDFMDDDLAIDRAGRHVDHYDIEVVVADHSMEILKEFLNKSYNARDDLRAYKEKAMEQFSYEQATGLFNDFFIEGMQSMYADNEVMAPWYRAPIIYNLQRDLLYDAFGGNMADIIEDAQSVMNNINPYNGNFYALDKFSIDMSEFLETEWAPGGARFEALQTPAVVKKFKNRLSYDSAGSVDAPYGSIYVDTGMTAEDLAAASTPKPTEDWTTFVVVLHRDTGFESRSLTVFAERYWWYEIIFKRNGSLITEVGFCDYGKLPWFSTPDTQMMVGTSNDGTNRTKIRWKSAEGLSAAQAFAHEGLSSGDVSEGPSDIDVVSRSANADRGAINATEYPDSYQYPVRMSTREVGPEIGTPASSLVDWDTTFD
jgi:hypothetical protein